MAFSQEDILSEFAEVAGLGHEAFSGRAGFIFFKKADTPVAPTRTTEERYKRRLERAKLWQRRKYQTDPAFRAKHLARVKAQPPLSKEKKREENLKYRAMVRADPAKLQRKRELERARRKRSKEAKNRPAST